MDKKEFTGGAFNAFNYHGRCIYCGKLVRIEYKHTRAIAENLFDSGQVKIFHQECRDNDFHHQ